MPRSLLVAFLLMLSLVLFVLAFKGNVSLSDPKELEGVATSSVSRAEARDILASKITDEIWRRGDIEKQIENAIPKDFSLFNQSATLSAKSALGGGISFVLSQGFLENAWGPAIQDKSTLRIVDVVDNRSAIFERQEILYLDLGVMLQEVIGGSILPDFIEKLIPKDIGKVELTQKASVSQVPTSSTIINLLPLPLLFLVLAFLFTLFVFERRTIWRGFLLASGAFLASFFVLLLVRDLFPPFEKGFSDPLAQFAAGLMREEWFSGLLISSRVLALVGLGLLLVSLLISPVMIRFWKQSLLFFEHNSPLVFDDVFEVKRSQEKSGLENERDTQRRDHRLRSDLKNKKEASGKEAGEKSKKTPSRSTKKNPPRSTKKTPPRSTKKTPPRSTKKTPPRSTKKTPPRSTKPSTAPKTTAVKENRSTKKKTATKKSATKSTRKTGPRSARKTTTNKKSTKKLD